MSVLRKAEHLVVDTTAFIKNDNLKDLADNLYTVQGVVDEIIDRRQLRNLIVLPYDLKIKDVFPENIKFVTEFSKKTGDYFSLSAVDIQVMGLTYQLEKQYVGTEHLRSVPVVQKVNKLSEHVSAAELGVTGFYMPPKKNKESLPETEGSEPVLIQYSEKQVDPDPGHDKEDLEIDVAVIEGTKLPAVEYSPNVKQEDSSNVPRSAPEVEIEGEEIIPELGEIEEVDSKPVTVEERLRDLEKENSETMQDLEEALQRTDMTDLNAESVEDIARTADEEDTEEEEDDIWDDNEWITPDNVEEAKRDLKAAQVEESPVKVACITGDFAMQNVIRQLGMKVLTTDGRIIKQLRTYILRCYSCFKTNSRMELLFCPYCGNRTLQRATVLLKADGSEEVLMSRKPPTTRGKRFSIPKPKGGKYAVNPILCPDQRMPQQLTSALARAKNNPLEPDYIAGYSPFLMRDVNSRSAVLGIRSTQTQIKNWMRRNPNEVVKKGKRRR